MGRNSVAVLIASLVVWLFSWSLSAPPGSEPDGSFHYSVIWCLRDSPKSACIDSNPTAADPRVVSVQVWDQMCYRGYLHRSAKCGDSPGVTTVEVAENWYPGGFYRTMNFFARGDIDQGTLYMRAINVLIAALMYGSALVVASRRILKSFVVSLLITLGPLHLSLIPMIHAQSWLIPSLGTGWVFVFVLVDRSQAIARRLVASMFWLLGLVLSFSSRIEGGPLYMAVSVTALVVALRTTEMPRAVLKRLTVIVGLCLVGLQFTDTVFSYRRWLAGIPEASADFGGPDSWEWFSSWVLAFPAVLIELYGTQGFANEMRPSLLLVPALGGLLLGGVIVSQIAQITRMQLKVVVVWLVLSLVSILSFTKSGLDLYDVDARYVTQFAHPFLGLFLVAGIGIIPVFDEIRLRRFLLVSLTLIAVLAQYFFLERYVRGVRPGLRPLTVGIDEWWWAGLGFGPNTLLLIGVGSYFLFASTALAVVEDVENVGTVQGQVNES